MMSIVLVHGAWHGGWCWERVASILRGQGFEVLTPTLTGLADRKEELTPETGLGTHVRDIGGLLAKQDLRESVLVGHSYASFVMTGVAEEHRDRISRLVYVDAFVPSHGQSQFDLIPEAAAMFRSMIEVTDGVSVIPPPPPEMFSMILDLSEPEDIAWVSHQLTAQPLKSFEEAVVAPKDAAAHLPRSYILCSDYFRSTWDGLEGDWSRSEALVGHDAMVTAPVRLAQAIADVL